MDIQKIENFTVTGKVKWGYRTKVIFSKGVIIGLAIGSVITVLLF